jgi:phosphopantothenoylcysteine decarboxylase/phosphopantothenate--cysteine ligase
MMGREVLVGVTGGIAAYKTAFLVSRLVQSGAAVTVIMTRSAEQFVGQSTFSALSGRPVHTELFRDERNPLGAHIELARRAELLCVAPASANFLAKAAHGLADDLLTTLYLCFQGPVLLAPAMNSEMWRKPAVQRNVAQVTADGARVIQPQDGWLSCREQGVGRMADPEQILQAVAAAMTAALESTA